MKKTFKIFCGTTTGRTVFMLFTLFTACFAVISCSNETYFNLGNNLIEPKFKIVYVDTCFVKLSTMKIDSTLTYNQATILVGKYEDRNTLNGDLLTGTTTATSFMEISRPQFSELNINTVFDSIVLEMRFNGFYMGDTATEKMHLFVHQLSERISKDDEPNQTFYNHASVGIENQPLAEVSFPITPGNTQSGIYLAGGFEIKPVRINLPDALGQDLFDKLKEGTAEVENSTNFLNYFRGLAFKAGDGVKTIVGFKADSTFKIRLYYHQENDFNIKSEIIFGINQSRQFNNIVSDRTGTALDEFTKEDTEIDAARTNNQAYIMAGDGLYAKIEFPYLSSILQLSDYGAVEKAVLEVKPVLGTYQKNTTLPKNINIYATSLYGESNSQLVNSQNQAQGGDLHEDAQFWNNTVYTYDISGFIQNQITAPKNSQMYLSLRLPSDEMQKTTNRLVIGNRDHSITVGSQTVYNKVTLKLYYNMYND